MKYRTRRLWAAIVVLAALPCIARAELIPIEEPFAVGSWAQRFQEAGIGPFDKMTIAIDQATPTASFLDPAFRTLSTSALALIDPGWNVVTSTDGKTASVSGAAVDQLYFDIAFADAIELPVTFDFAAYLGDYLLMTAVVSWNSPEHPATWNIVSTEEDIIPVPLPSAGFAAIGTLGLLTLGARCRRQQ
jgi:hypothetical protein